MEGEGRGFLVTGTDTGCGKTTVTLALMQRLQNLGLKVRPVKPIASGAASTNGVLLNDDVRLLANASGLEPSAINFWTFAQPAAPAVAANLEGVTLDLAILNHQIRQCFAPETLTLVEGAGGLLCPLNETQTFADLAGLVGIPLLLVVRRSLGTLNHTLLTLEVASHRRLSVAGVIVSETEPVDGIAQLSCLDELRKRIAVPILGRLPYRNPGGSTRLTDCEPIDWWQIAGEPRTCKR